jgi:hypothetical protein
MMVVPSIDTSHLDAPEDTAFSITSNQAQSVFYKGEVLMGIPAKALKQ